MMDWSTFECFLGRWYLDFLSKTNIFFYLKLNKVDFIFVAIRLVFLLIIKLDETRLGIEVSQSRGKNNLSIGTNQPQMVTYLVRLTRKC